MWLSVAFPTCPNCNKNANKCYHKNCPKGATKPMEINPDTSFVRCPSCDKTWPIKESNYYCSCDYIFTAEDVSVEIEAIVATARLIAQEIKRTSETKKRINEMTIEAIENTATTTIKKSFGEKVWSALKDALPIIVAAIRMWLKID